MSSLQAQYENFLKENPTSDFSYQEWYTNVFESKFLNSLEDLEFQDFTEIENEGSTFYED
ncbi:hypothetical protein EBS02_01680 [bacterium]|nr:hypothetical protein [bacterium]